MINSKTRKSAHNLRNSKVMYIIRENYFEKDNFISIVTQFFQIKTKITQNLFKEAAKYTNYISVD